MVVSQTSNTCLWENQLSCYEKTTNTFYQYWFIFWLTFYDHVPHSESVSYLSEKAVLWSFLSFVKWIYFIAILIMFKIAMFYILNFIAAKQVLGLVLNRQVYFFRSTVFLLEQIKQANNVFLKIFTLMDIG
jgi:hypothetical protein